MGSRRRPTRRVDVSLDRGRRTSVRPAAGGPGIRGTAGSRGGTPARQGPWVRGLCAREEGPRVQILIHAASRNSDVDLPRDPVVKPRITRCRLPNPVSRNSLANRLSRFKAVSDLSLLGGLEQTADATRVEETPDRRAPRLERLHERSAEATALTAPPSGGGCASGSSRRARARSSRRPSRTGTE